MKKIILSLTLTLAFLFGLSVNSNAILVLSGDSNIAQDLSDTSYNNVFFQNILQGGDNVLVLSENQNGGPVDYDQGIVDYYNSLSGITSTLYDGYITADALNNVNLFVALLPDDAFTEEELYALSSFYVEGGSIFFLGEHSSWDDTSNAYINLALNYLNSEMSIILGNTMPDDGGPRYIGSGLIDPLTEGVYSLRYGAPSEVRGGTYLFYGGVSGLPFIAYEQGVTNPVPEPATMLLLGSGILGLAGFRRRLRRR